MKLYAKRNGVTVEAEVERGAIYLEIGSTDSGNGNLHHRLPPIVVIDEEARTIRRMHRNDEPFPDHFYREADIAWKPCAP